MRTDKPQPIENNTLSLEQITALFEGKNVLAPLQDICEAQNAFEVYDRLLGISTVWASKILRKMVEEGLVNKVGKNRYTYYLLKSDETTSMKQ